MLHYMSFESRSNGDFRRWLDYIESNKALGNNLSKDLLFNGHSLCSHFDEGAFSELIKSIRRGAGLGKGLITATLCYMPETFSRSALKQWRVSKAEMAITEAEWEGLLLNAFNNQRFHLAGEMMSFIRKEYGEEVIVSVLTCLDEDTLIKTRPLWMGFRSVLVQSLCSHQSWVGAIRLAGDDINLKKKVLNAISEASGYKSRSRTWPRLLQHMINKSGQEFGVEGAFNKFKSAARVTLKEVMSIPEEKIPSELDTEELKKMAFSLGMDEAIKHMKTPKAKRESLSHSLGL